MFGRALNAGGAIGNPSGRALNAGYRREFASGRALKDLCAIGLYACVMRSTRAPKGQQALSPGQASEAMRHPGLGGGAHDAPPEGAKAVTGGMLVGVVAGSGGVYAGWRGLCP